MFAIQNFLIIIKEAITLVYKIQQSTPSNLHVDEVHANRTLKYFYRKDSKGSKRNKTLEEQRKY